MRSMLIASVLSLSMALSLTACGGGGEEAYDTFQDCFDDHNQVEALPVAESIVICCLEHPINGVTEVCGADAVACETYVDNNLDTASATVDEITAACADYESQL